MTACDVRRSLAAVSLNDLDLLVLEGFSTDARDLGQELTVAMLSVAAGDDKAAE